MLLDEVSNCNDECGERSLHVGSAAAVEHLIPDRRHERVARPLLERPGRHDVGVAGKAHQRNCGAAPRPQVVDAAHADLLAFEAERLQLVAQDVEAAGIVG